MKFGCEIWMSLKSEWVWNSKISMIDVEEIYSSKKYIYKIYDIKSLKIRCIDCFVPFILHEL